MLKNIQATWDDRLLRLSFVCILLIGFSAASIGPFQSIIGIERLGISDQAYAVVSTLGAIISVVAAVSLGIYTDQTGKNRSVLAWCNGVGIIAGGVMFLLPSTASFVLVHVILLPIALTVFSQYFAVAALAANKNVNLEKDSCLSLIRAGFAGSFALTPPLWAIVIANGTDLLMVYFFIAVASAMSLTIILWSWPNNEQYVELERSGVTFLTALGEIGATRVWMRLVLICVIVGINGLYNILLGLIVVTKLGGAEADVGWFAGGISLIEVPVMLFAPLLLRWMSRPELILIGVLFYAVFLSLLGLFPNIYTAWVLIIPGAIGAGITLSISLGYLQDLVKDRPGAGSALLSVSHFGGSIYAALILAGGASLTDYVGTAWIGSGLGLLAALFLVFLDRPNARSL